MATVTDPFTRADNTDLGPDWDSYSGYNPLHTASNEARPGAVGGADTMESWNANSFNDDQFFASTLGTWGDIDGGYAGGILRAAPPDTATMYFLYAKGLGSTIYKRVAGVSAAIADEGSTDWNSGDVARGESEGTTLRLKKNGSLVLSGTDTAIASGRVGIAAYVGASLATSDVTISTWTGGDLASGIALSVSDSLAPSITDSAVVAVAMFLAVSDSLTPSVTDSAAVVTGEPIAKAGADTLTPSLTDVGLVQVWEPNRRTAAVHPLFLFGALSSMTPIEIAAADSLAPSIADAGFVDIVEFGGSGGSTGTLLLLDVGS